MPFLRELLARLVEAGERERVLIVEVAIENPWGKPGLRGDLGHRGGLHARAGEDRVRGLQDAPAPRLGVLAGDSRHTRTPSSRRAIPTNSRVDGATGRPYTL